jgi:GH25 family lysozyme M1 (1,4-beta-N-acetylmuramidase)
MITGQDISEFQGQIDFGVYKNNTNFVICKVSEGVGYIDSWFGYNRTQARLMGIPLGYYHFARPDLGNSPQTEATFFCNLLDGDPIKEGEVICLDFEVTFTDCVSWCKQWLDAVSAHFGGMKPLIYLDQFRTQGFDWTPVVNAGYGLWLASYNPQGQGQTGKWTSMAMQQWTSSQKVPGIAGNCDGDWFFGDVNQFKAYGYKKPVVHSASSSPSPSPSKSPSPSPSASPSPAPPVTPPPSPSTCEIDLSKCKDRLKQINVIASKSHWFYKGDFQKIKDLSS